MANPLLLLFQTLLSTVVGALAAPALPNYASICRIKQSSDGVICQCSPEINQLEINNQTLIQILQENQRSADRIFIRDCREVDIDLGRFSRVQVENITQVRVHDLRVASDTDLIIKKAESVSIEGQVELATCTTEEQTGCHNQTWQRSEYQVAGNGNSLSRPHLIVAKPDYDAGPVGGGPPILQVKAWDVANLTLDKLATSDQVDFRLGVTGAGSVVIKDSRFNHLAPSAIQVSQTPVVTVGRSQFFNASIGCLALDGGNITIKDSLMAKRALLLRSPDQSSVQFRCTASPDHLEYDIQVMLESSEDCAVTVSQWTLESAETECAGAITLAAVSAAILMLVVGILLYMDRTGRLENYL